MAAVDWNALYGYAQSLLGKPYVYGGGGGGFDCSSFTQAVYASQGLQIGRDTSAQLRSGATVGQDGNWASAMQNIQPGDLIFYGAPGASGPNAHVVMYIGNGQVIQAGGRSVNTTSLFQSASPTTPFLGVRRYTPIVNAPTQMTSATGGAAGANPQVPNANDIPALDAYIRQNYPNEAWLLDVPEVKQVLEQGVAAGQTETQLQAELQNTQWWKHTSQAQISFLNLQHATPEELNFGDPGSKASQALAHVQTMAGQVGMAGLPMSTLKQIALNSMQYGWADAQIQQKIGSYAWVKPAGAGVTSNDPTLVNQLTGLAGKYLYNPSDTVLNSYIQGIASGNMTMATFQAFLAQQAAAKYPTMAAAITAGQDPNSIIDPLRQEAAKTMEMTPDQINFISDPFYSQILNYRPPAVAGKQQAPRVMSASEMDTYLRKSTQYGYTQQARDQASGLARQIAVTFGEVKN